MAASDPFGARRSLGTGQPDIYALAALAERDISPGLDLARVPMTLKVLLENVLRHAGGGIVSEADVATLASWRPGQPAEAEVPFMPARVILQDFTGVPAVVDLAVMRDAMADLGGDPARVNPLVPADLVIDHSVQVDQYGTPAAFLFNVSREYDRNTERYQLLRWAQTAFRGLRVVPPGTGIVHQVNLEYLATVVTTRDGVAFPDTLVGTDSHTTMINGLGVLGYGVGGIEAEAVLLGQPLYQPMPRIVGVRLTGELPRGSTATDLVLVVTEMLRGFGVVGSFVEFAGDGLASLALADRATIANMSPEFGATSTLFPIDDETLTYLRLTGRPAELVDLVERYARAQGLWRDPGPGPDFDARMELDLATVAPSVAGPRRPQDRVLLEDLPANFRGAFPNAFPGPSTALAQSGMTDEGGTTGALENGSVVVEMDGRQAVVRSGSVAIAAITSCTNTSNPTVMVGAGLLARNAVARGLTVAPTVKTSLAPGSKAVTGYLETAGLMAPLAALGFALAGYGCTTCIGNSGPLDEAVAEAIEAHDLVVAAVLSGNRNFEGRIHPLARASYLASPPLVVAFALAGRVDIDLTTEPLGMDRDGRPVMLADLWPSSDEIKRVIQRLDRPGALPADLRDGLRRRRPLARAADPGRRPLRLGGRLHVRGEAAVLRGADGRARGRSRHRRSARAGRPRRLGDDGPHQPGRFDRARIARRPLAPGPRGRAARLQLVRGPARPPRGHDARHLREHPAAQRARRRQGGPVHRPPARRDRGHDLRRRDALPGRGDAPAHHRRQGIRLWLVA